LAAQVALSAGQGEHGEEPPFDASEHRRHPLTCFKRDSRRAAPFLPRRGSFFVAPLARRSARALLGAYRRVEKATLLRRSDSCLWRGYR
jgi:hypothetical protein